MFRHKYSIIITAVLLTTAGCSKKVLNSEMQNIPDSFPNELQIKREAPPETVVTAVRTIQDLLSNIYFDYDQAALRPEAVAILDRVGPYMVKYSSIRLRAEGHCDERGSSEYNLGLGEKRSDAVKNWLVAYGVAAARIETTSYGKEQPASFHCIDESCHANNRRVEWKVLSQSERLALKSY